MSKVGEGQKLLALIHNIQIITQPWSTSAAKRQDRVRSFCCYLVLYRKWAAIIGTLGDIRYPRPTTD